ncbi:MAG TPA: NAD-dependent epimerase/dehydratase family protein [Thermoplasmata archaeon]|nr:NAD-dependent epimerase/dehydratase family protein [Thermoplasmata archaeon]
MPNSADDLPAVVTGGAGAIGSALVQSLLGRGRTVRVIDNLSGGRREHLPAGPGAARLSLTVADIREPATYAEAFRGAGEVWHLAANPDIRLGTRDPRVDLEHGTIATFNVLETARRFDVRRVLFSSSSAVYGLPTVFPTPETYGPLYPQSQYGASKLAAEGLCSAFAHSYGLTTYLFRFANIVGPGMTHAVIYDLLKKLQADPSRLEVLGDGRQAKSYLWVDDCVEGMHVAKERASAPVNLFNLGTEGQTSVREIAERVTRAMGGRAQIVYTGGTRGWVGDIPLQLLATDRIRALGWTPKFTSSEAVDRTIAVTREELGL